MEFIGKISKGSKMDQIYIPKNREGLVTGSYVLIKPLDKELELKQTIIEKPYFYNIDSIEPIKLNIMKEIFFIITKITKNYNNIIIIGSFLDREFNFNDIDIIIISEEKLNTKNIEKLIENKIKIKTHIILLDNKALIKGLETDPLYQIMLSKCIAKKRFIYKIKNKINYKILDLHLLKSKILINNFDIINGNEKYKLIRNLVAISLFLKNIKLSKEKVDKKIIKYFNVNNINQIKQNMLNKVNFIKKYKSLYNKTFNKIINSISKNAAK